MSDFASRIRSSVQAELDAAAEHERRGEFATAFRRLERAHVLGQFSTREHVRAHWAMLCWGVRQRAHAEVIGQWWRLLGALLKTAPGWVPTGNTGGSRVSGFQPMPVPRNLQRVIDAARAAAAR